MAKFIIISALENQIDIFAFHFATAIEMNTLHLNDNVHHIRGLTPRAESELSDALTSPSLMASPLNVPLDQLREDSATSTNVTKYPAPETSRTNTPTPVSDDKVGTNFF